MGTDETGSYLSPDLYLVGCQGPQGFIRVATPVFILASIACYATGSHSRGWPQTIDIASHAVLGCKPTGGYTANHSRPWGAFHRIPLLAQGNLHVSALGMSLLVLPA